MSALPSRSRPEKPRVGLFVTCLVDLMRPSVGFAAVKLLEDAGCVVEAPVQTCCGQPAYNSGDRGTTRDLAMRLIEAFQGYDYVVAPSGSCAGMIKAHYPSFLVDVLGVTKVDAAFDGAVTYHDSCSGLRELKVKTQPRRLLASVEGLTLVEMKDSDVCCGFGGTFAVKYSDISGAIVEAKARNIEEAHAPTLLAGDLGCLMNMAGKLSRDGRPIQVRHVAEVLAGMTDEPPIGAAKEPRRA
jgi:L-lactate dehydrogenase complex protein LldE